MRTISWEPTNVRRVRLRQTQKIKRRPKFGQETFETCLERKTSDVIQLQPIRLWKYTRGILKVMSFLYSLPDKLSFFRGY